MADAPTAPSKTDEQKKAAEAKKAAAKKAQDKKAADKKATDEKAADQKGAPTEGEAVAQTPVLNGIHPGAHGLPTLLDPFQARDELAKALSDLEQTINRVENGLSAHFDLTGLRRHLEGARKWFGNELGLEVQNGQLVRNDGGTQLPAESDGGGTGDESPAGKKQLQEAAKNRAKAQKADK